MKAFEFFMNYWSVILLAVLIIAALIFAIYKKDYSIVNKLIFSLVIEAEQAYGSGTGVLKLSTVIAALYPKLPKLFKMFVTEKRLTAMIESVLADAKKKWEANPKLLKVESEGIK